MSVPTPDEKENTFTAWWNRWHMLEDKDKRRVWIDSQTEEEILRGIREAKPICLNMIIWQMRLICEPKKII